MTKEEIIAMAKSCGWDNPATNMMPLYEFAKLVAEAERDACAKIVENRILHDKNENIKKGYFFAQQSIAEDIRARGDKND
jgi:hypothetical protein